jgi:hypothetical protein
VASLVMRMHIEWTVTDWLATVVSTFGIAGILTGLVTLFFTKSQAKHWVGNFAITAWVVLALTTFGWYSGVTPRPHVASQPALGAVPQVDWERGRLTAPDGTVLKEAEPTR